MNIEFSCGKCGQSITIDNDTTYETVQCPACRCWLKVPTPDAAGTMTIHFRCSNCDGLLRSPAEQAQKKAQCPHCYETIVVPKESITTSPRDTSPTAKAEAGKPKVKLYYLNEDGKDSGPFTLGQLQSMWQIGKITAATSYFSEGMNEWRQLADMIPALESKTDIPRLKAKSKTP